MIQRYRSSMPPRVRALLHALRHPGEWSAERYRALEPIGPMLLLGLVLIGSISRVSVFGTLISPIVRTLSAFFTGGLLG